MVIYLTLTGIDQITWHISALVTSIIVLQLLAEFQFSC